MIAINLNIDYLSGQLLLFAFKNSLNYFPSLFIFFGLLSGDCSGNEDWMSLFRYGGIINTILLDKRCCPFLHEEACYSLWEIFTFSLGFYYTSKSVHSSLLSSLLSCTIIIHTVYY